MKYGKIQSLGNWVWNKVSSSTSKSSQITPEEAGRIVNSEKFREKCFDFSSICNERTIQGVFDDALSKAILEVSGSSKQMKFFMFPVPTSRFDMPELFFKRLHEDPDKTWCFVYLSKGSDSMDCR